MNLTHLFTRFVNDQDGAVTVDWVVLTAGLVGLAAIVGTTIAGNVEATAQNINTTITGNAAVDTTLDGQ